MSNIKVSVIVPVYNMEERLYRCLASLKEITCKDVEFLLINDGSTDNSEFICKKFVSEDERFIYKYKKNGGVSSARNLGFTFAKGKYISYVDSDDYIDPKSWSKLYDIAEENDVDILNFGYSYVKKEIVEKRNSVLPKNKLLVHKDVQSLLSSDVNSSNFLWFPWSNFFKKSLIDTNSITYREDILSGMEDTIFILECFCKAKTIYSIDSPCYYYVYYGDSLTQKRFKPDLLNNVNRQFEARLEIYEEHGLMQSPYLLHLGRHYMEHTFFAGLKNAKNKEEGGFINVLNNMRIAPVYNRSLKYYKPSKYCTIKMKVLIYLFKFRLFKLLKAVY